jgi:uncharacterized membrane protein
MYRISKRGDKKLGKNQKNKKQSKYTIYIVSILLLVILVSGYKFLTANGKSSEPGGIVTNDTIENGNIKIAKKDITKEAKFYSYDAEGTYMEVLAVKANDGTIRTALNTCQVCYDSGRGYYKQQGDTLICQNCGNVFGIDDIEVLKGGCNPIPIFEESKTDDGENIIIAGEFLNKNKGYFAKWNK